MATNNLTPKGRVYFPQVFKAVSYQGGKEKFSLVLVFDVNSMDAQQKTLFKNMVDQANQAARDKFKVPLGESYRSKPLTSPFRRTDDADGDYYPPGCIFVRLSSLNAPSVKGSNPEAPDLDENTFYPGCFAHASYMCYAYDTSGNRGVSFGLNNIQKTGDGERAGSGVKTEATDDFDVVEGNFSDVGDDPQVEDAAAAAAAAAAAPVATTPQIEDDIPF